LSEVIEKPVKTELLTHTLSARTGQTDGKVRVLQDPKDRLGESLSVTRRNKQARHSVSDDLGNSPHRSGNNRKAVGPCFQN
jgi:hypothetical protein